MHTCAFMLRIHLKRRANRKPVFCVLYSRKRVCSGKTGRAHATKGPTEHKRRLFLRPCALLVSTQPTNAKADGAFLREGNYQVWLNIILVLLLLAIRRRNLTPRLLRPKVYHRIYPAVSVSYAHLRTTA